jgi:hypothetical protein
MLFFRQPTRPSDRAHRRLGCTLYFGDGSKRELPSSGLMSASSGCGHAVASGYVPEVPLADICSAAKLLMMLQQRLSANPILKIGSL